MSRNTNQTDNETPATPQPKADRKIALLGAALVGFVFWLAYRSLSDSPGVPTAPSLEPPTEAGVRTDPAAVPSDTAVSGLPEPDLSSLEPQVAEKVRESQQAVLDDPASSNAWGQLGMVFQSHGMLSEAAECYQRASEHDVEEFRWHYLLAHSLRAAAPDNALRHAERASELRPRYAPAHVLRAGLQEELGQPEEAFELYDEALQVDPGCAPAHFGLGRLFLARGDAQSSVSHLQRATELQPDAASVHSSLARAYRLLGDTVSATAEAKLASEREGELNLEDAVMVAMMDEDVSTNGYRQRGQRAAAPTCG